MNEPIHSDDYVAALQAKVIRLESQNAKLVEALELCELRMDHRTDDPDDDAAIIQAHQVLREAKGKP